ncbi:hypothetical protein MSG28_009667 [Choristoneura fumiferana]|uniref:Uncharacterized protein n=1 Tax=Choristoneura fumiferana TaxID=7141 RepID=A0ACC0JC43_CHOFU|nr:hypothetical protein MSG28_009667 [Choristoneura fumiferana]
MAATHRTLPTQRQFRYTHSTHTNFIVRQPTGVRWCREHIGAGSDIRYRSGQCERQEQMVQAVRLWVGREWARNMPWDAIRLSRNDVPWTEFWDCEAQSSGLVLTPTNARLWLTCLFIAERVKEDIAAVKNRQNTNYNVISSFASILSDVEQGLLEVTQSIPLIPLPARNSDYFPESVDPERTNNRNRNAITCHKYVITEMRLFSTNSRIMSRPIYVPLLGTGLLSEQEGLGYSSHAGPVRIGNFTRTIELLRRK